MESCSWRKPSSPGTPSPRSSFRAERRPPFAPARSCATPHWTEAASPRTRSMTRCASNGASSWTTGPGRRSKSAKDRSGWRFPARISSRTSWETGWGRSRNGWIATETSPPTRSSVTSGTGTTRWARTPRARPTRSRTAGESARSTSAAARTRSTGAAAERSRRGPPNPTTIDGRSALFHGGSMKLVRVGAAVLNQTPLDWNGNRDRILDAISQARDARVSILCFPELCITGYGCEDAFQSPGLWRTAFEVLQEIVPATRGLVVSVGLPLVHRNSLFNTAAMLVDGEIVGFMAKRFLAGEGLYYEPRWFKPWPEAAAG